MKKGQLEKKNNQAAAEIQGAIKEAALAGEQPTLPEEPISQFEYTDVADRCRAFLARHEIGDDETVKVRICKRGPDGKFHSQWVSVVYPADIPDEHTIGCTYGGGDYIVYMENIPKEGVKNYNSNPFVIPESYTDYVNEKKAKASPTNAGSFAPPVPSANDPANGGGFPSSLTDNLAFFKQMKEIFTPESPAKQLADGMQIMQDFTERSMRQTLAFQKQMLEEFGGKHLPEDPDDIEPHAPGEGGEMQAQAGAQEMPWWEPFKEMAISYLNRLVTGTPAEREKAGREILENPVVAGILSDKDQKRQLIQYMVTQLSEDKVIEILKALNVVND